VERILDRVRFLEADIRRLANERDLLVEELERRKEPGPPPEDWLTKTVALRSAATTSDAAFERYVASGLLGEPVSGLYPPDTPERLARINEAKSEARMLCRRIVRLRAEQLFWSMSPGKLGEAMIELAPQVRAAKRKMLKLENALAAYGRYLSKSPIVVRRPYGLPQGWRPPSQSEWANVLKADPALTELRAGPSYGMALNVLPAFVAGTSLDLTAIPIEEQVLMLTVRDVAATLAMREAAARIARWREQGDS
jgi:hypothetical protein